MQKKLKDRIKFLELWVEYLEAHPPKRFFSKSKWNKKRFRHEDQIMQLKDEISGRKQQLAAEQAKEMEAQEKSLIMQQEYQLVVDALKKNKHRLKDRKQLGYAQDIIEGKTGSFESQWQYFEWARSFLRAENIRYQQQVVVE